MEHSIATVSALLLIGLWNILLLQSVLCNLLVYGTFYCYSQCFVTYWFVEHSIATVSAL